MSKQIDALKLALEALEKLWNIIDDIDTYGDMAKDDEKLYRSLVERRQRTRFEETGITTDGYGLSGGAITAIKEALAQPEQEPDDLTIAYMAGFSRGKDAAPQRTAAVGEDTRRAWIGLTDKEIRDFVIYPMNPTSDLVRLVEMKLKEKNMNNFLTKGNNNA